MCRRCRRSIFSFPSRLPVPRTRDPCPGETETAVAHRLYERQPDWNTRRGVVGPSRDIAGQSGGARQSSHSQRPFRLSKRAGHRASFGRAQGTDTLSCCGAASKLYQPFDWAATKESDCEFVNCRGQKKPDLVAEAGLLVGAITPGSLVAGTGFEPVTFRL
jgi:hypothetical protein